jgi:hypothetical protein
MDTRLEATCNLNVTSLAIRGSSFASTRDFKWLRVTKRSRATTSTFMVSTAFTNGRACRIMAKTGKAPQQARTPVRTRFASRCLSPLSASWFEFAVIGQLRPDLSWNTLQYRVSGFVQSPTSICKKIGARAQISGKSNCRISGDFYCRSIASGYFTVDGNKHRCCRTDTCFPSAHARST